MHIIQVDQFILIIHASNKDIFEKIKMKSKNLRIIGLTLDIIGGSLIASAVILETGKRVSGESLPELESDIDNSTNQETIISIIGLIFLIFGFILLFASEFV